MATKFIFSYITVLPSTLPKDATVAYFKDALDITLTFVSPNGEMKYVFMVDAESSSIFLSETHQVRYHFPSSIAEFVANMDSCTGYIFFRTYKNISNISHPWGLMGKEKIYDYSKTITDLEGKGKIFTCRSTSTMATDERKFSFSKIQDVDCLGTTLCPEITEKVITMWKQEFEGK